MIDNEQQVDVLENYAQSVSPTPAPWPVFIKIDVGSHRAGMENASPLLPKLIQRVERSPAATVDGLYCHAGHSYGCRSQEAAVEVLQTEVAGVIEASKHLTPPGDGKIVLSVGSTPTAHVVNTLRKNLPGNMELELHAGKLVQRGDFSNNRSITNKVPRRKLPVQRPPAGQHRPRQRVSASFARPRRSLQCVP